MPTFLYKTIMSNLHIKIVWLLLLAIFRIITEENHLHTPRRENISLAYWLSFYCHNTYSQLHYCNWDVKLFYGHVIINIFSFRPSPGHSAPLPPIFPNAPSFRTITNYAAVRKLLGKWSIMCIAKRSFRIRIPLKFIAFLLLCLFVPLHVNQSCGRK